MPADPVSDPRSRVTQRGGAGEQEIIDALNRPTVRIVLPEDTERRETQLIAVVMTDLLGRVFPRLDVVGNLAVAAHSDLSPGAATLDEALHVAREQGTKPMRAGDPTVTVAVGAATGPADMYVDGSGWQSYVGSGSSRLSSLESPVPIGALAAGCRGAAYAFGRALEGLFAAPATPAHAYSSALTWTSAIAPLDEPPVDEVGRLEAALVGAGSVGGAAIYALARTRGLGGTLDVVDPQALEPTNFDRALLAGRPIASQGLDKSRVAAMAMAHLAPEVVVHPHRKTIEEFVASRHQDQVLPLVLCCVDSASARRSLQDCLPLEVVNAACWPEEIALSRHITGAGPCVCCLHMADVMNAEMIRARLISRATGINFPQVVVMLAQKVPLDAQALRFVEIRTGRPENSLAGYEGGQLADLWRDQFMYGAAQVRTSSGTVAGVAAPWVTALAGVLLAAEAIKSTMPDTYGQWRLGPAVESPGTKYAENPYASPLDSILSRPPRWEGDECLCRSPRRLSLTKKRYGLEPEETGRGR